MAEEEDIVTMIVAEEEETKTKRRVFVVFFLPEFSFFGKNVALAGLSTVSPLLTVSLRGIVRRSSNPPHDVPPHPQWG